MNQRVNGTLEEVHPLNGKKHEDIRTATQENTNKITSCWLCCEKNLWLQVE